MDNLKLGALFIFQGLLTLFFTLFSFDANAVTYEIPLGGVALGVIYVWVGRLLRRREPKVRFFALGPCLLMVIGAVVVPLLALAGAAATGILTELGVASGLVGSPAKAMIGALLVSAYAITMGVFGYRGLKYLRSAEGRLDFANETVDRTAKLPHESVGVVLASAVVAIAGAVLSTRLDFGISYRVLPSILQTKEMDEFEDRLTVRANKHVSRGAIFTLDSRRIVFLPMLTQREFLVLDLDSGNLRRVETDFDASKVQFQVSVAPDGSSILGGEEWISLTTGKSRHIDGISSKYHIGFAGPSRLLAYDRSMQKLELIDLERGVAIYSRDVPAAERGDPHGNSTNWSSYAQQWSPDRRRYFWLGRSGTFNDMDVASGSVERVPCPRCEYGSRFIVSPAGDSVFVASNVSDGGRATIGQVYGVANRRIREFAYHGMAVENGHAADFALAQNFSGSVLYRELDGNSSRQWMLGGPQGSRLRSVMGRSRLALQVADRNRVRTLIGEFDAPSKQADVRYFEPRLALMNAEEPTISPDGRYLLYVAGAKIEVIDLDALARGEPANRTMDLLEDDELEKVTPDSETEPPFVARWREIEPLPPATESAEIPIGPVVVERPSDYPAAAATAIDELPPIEDLERPAPNGGAILKCVDGAGKVTFTQVSCPPGTRLQ
jgi:hypothetical protein